MSLITNDHGGMTYVKDMSHQGADRRCEMLDAVRMLVDSHIDLCDAIRRQYGDAALPHDLQVRIDFADYMIKRIRHGELAQLARVCNASR